MFEAMHTDVPHGLDVMSASGPGQSLEFDRPALLVHEVHAVGVMLFAARCGMSGLELAMWSIEQCLEAEGTERLLDKLGW
jgi:hypothetical protein